MSTHNIGFCEDLTKIIFELSSNTHLISSADEGFLLMKVSKLIKTCITKPLIVISNAHPKILSGMHS